MGRKRATPKSKELTLEFKDGYWWLVDGKNEENLGRSKRYAEKLLAERKEA